MCRATERKGQGQVSEGPCFWEDAVREDAGQLKIKQKERVQETQSGEPQAWGGDLKTGILGAAQWRKDKGQESGAAKPGSGLAAGSVHRDYWVFWAHWGWCPATGLWYPKNPSQASRDPQVGSLRGQTGQALISHVALGSLSTQLYPRGL